LGKPRKWQVFKVVNALFTAELECVVLPKKVHCLIAEKLVYFEHSN
jgi:hypothetical protein